MSQTAPQLTKGQHYVPRFYLNSWCNKNGQVVCHDLSSNNYFIKAPENLLLRRYYYETDRDNPDNRVENILSDMEGTTAAVFNKIKVQCFQNVDRIPNIYMRIQQVLTSKELDTLAEFAAYQYLRVPGAIAQKRREIEPASTPARDLILSLNPGHFTESGYAYVRDRFAQMKLLLMISPGRELITSDRPCFDMKDSSNTPLLGEDIGQNPKVICYMPLTPKLGVVFYHARFNAKSRNIPRLISRNLTDGEVKTLNALVIQGAERYVISSQHEDYIFRIADKRKKQST